MTAVAEVGATRGSSLALSRVTVPRTMIDERDASTAIDSAVCALVGMQPTTSTMAKTA